EKHPAGGRTTTMLKDGDATRNVELNPSPVADGRENKNPSNQKRQTTSPKYVELWRELQQGVPHHKIQPNR
ncbi:hypothetical protein OS493_040018, partial [Desmophyllum pertusum]